MSKEYEDRQPKPEIAENKKKKADKPKKELTPQEIQKRKKILVYPLFFLIFAGAMWLIFAPSGNKQHAAQPAGFNSELPIPKDEAIVGDKREAYEREAMQSKQQEKMRTLQDFSFLAGEEEGRYVADDHVTEANNVSDYTDSRNISSVDGIRSSAYAYQDVNRQLNSWYDQSVEKTDGQAQLDLEHRVQELERQLEEKSSIDQQLNLIEKSYAIAAKHMAAPQVQPVAAGGQQGIHSEITVNTGNSTHKIVCQSVSQVQQNVVSLLSVPMENEVFPERYTQPRNMGFITAAGKEDMTVRNSIRASVYRTVTLSSGKELQLRLLEPMRAGDILIPTNTILVGSTKLGSERLHITITSIQYADNVIPVELEVYDIDGLQGIFVPNSTEISAVKEMTANMGASTGSSITIGGNAGSQLAADLGRNVMQGFSQYISKKMREVKVTLKAGYKVLLLPKT